MMSRMLAVAALALLPTSFALAQSPVALRGTATLKNAEGAEVGRVDLQQGPAGVV